MKYPFISSKIKFPFNKLKHELLTLSFINSELNGADFFNEQTLESILYTNIFNRISDDIELLWLYQHSDYPQKQLLLKDNKGEITTIDLSSQRISSMPNLSILPNLVSLDLSNNKLTTIPSLETCKKLEFLDLSRNNIIDLSALNLPRLEFLDIQNNLSLTNDSFVYVQLHPY